MFLGNPTSHAPKERDADEELYGGKSPILVAADGLSQVIDQDSGKP